MVWRNTPRNPRTTLLHRVEGHVGVRWGEVVMVDCFVSPNRTLAEYEMYLDGIRTFISQHLSGPVLVHGDFNAHATAWGSSKTNARGETLLEWTAGLDLLILNRGRRSTCVRPTGESIVDISFASPAASRRATIWRVEEGVELLTKWPPPHLHAVPSPALGPAPGGSRRAPKRKDRLGLMVAAAAHG